MNKYQEALDKIVKSCCPNCDTEGCKDCSIEKICNATAKDWVDTLQELLDKETPKEIKLRYEDTIHETTVSIPCCPCCKSDLEYDEQKYCHECGQKIEW